MPYITKERKEIIDNDLDSLLILLNNRTDIVAGDLNYIFTKIALQYLEKVGHNYQNMNNVVGALEGCKLEFYRRLVSNYEDQKANINGDVY